MSRIPPVEMFLKGVGALEGQTLSFMSIKLLKNGQLVSFARDGTLKIWDPLLKENNLLCTIKGNGYTSRETPFVWRFIQRLSHNP